MDARLKNLLRLKKKRAIADIDKQLDRMDGISISLAAGRGYHEGRRDVLKELISVFEEMESDRNDSRH